MLLKLPNGKKREGFLYTCCLWPVSNADAEGLESTISHILVCVGNKVLSFSFR
jgi:hypothetical protein